MSSRQPNGTFNAYTDALPTSGQAPRRPAGSGRTVQFPATDNTNSALRKIITSADVQEQPVDAQTYSMGTADALPSSNLGQMFFGMGTAKSEVQPRFNTGFGGMSQAALNRVGQLVPNANTPTMPGTTPVAGKHNRSVEGIPPMEGLEMLANNYGARALRTGFGVNPASRTMNGMMFDGFGPRPTQLDTIGSMGGPDPRDPGRVQSASNIIGSQLQTSAAEVNELTTLKPYEEVNVTVPHQVIVRPFMSDYSNQDARNQFLMVCRSEFTLNSSETEKSVASKLLFSSGVKRTAQRYMLLTVHEFNYLMASREVAPDNLDAETSVYDVINQFRMSRLGVEDTGRDTTNATQYASGDKDKVINGCVAGTARSYNYWGKNGRMGNYALYFILKRVDRAELAEQSHNAGYGHVAMPVKAAKSRTDGESGSRKYRLTDYTGSNTLMYKLGERREALPVFETAENNKKLHKRPFQLVPYAVNSTEGVPLAARRYERLDGSTEYGIVFQVGYTYEGMSGTSSPGAPLMPMNVDELFRAGMINMAVSIQMIEA